MCNMFWLHRLSNRRCCQNPPKLPKLPKPPDGRSKRSKAHQNARQCAVHSTQQTRREIGDTRHGRLRCPAQSKENRQHEKRAGITATIRCTTTTRKTKRQQENTAGFDFFKQLPSRHLEDTARQQRQPRHRTAPHRTALHRTALHCTAPHRTAPALITTKITMEQAPVQIGQYILQKNLGIGAFGKVRISAR